VGFHYGPVRQVSAVCEKIYILAEVTENNGRSWAGVLVKGVDIGFGTYVFGGHLQ
jgi:hypothetical protein